MQTTSYQPSCAHITPRLSLPGYIHNQQHACRKCVTRARCIAANSTMTCHIILSVPPIKGILRMCKIKLCHQQKHSLGYRIADVHPMPRPLDHINHQIAIKYTIHHTETYHIPLHIPYNSRSRLLGCIRTQRRKDNAPSQDEAA